MDTFVDVVFITTGGLKFIIKKDLLEIEFYISVPKKYKDIWKQIRNSKNGSNHYQGSKMTARNGYNITVLFSETDDSEQYIKCIDGIVKFGIKLERAGATHYSLLTVKIPIESCYDAFDKIIEVYEID